MKIEKLMSTPVRCCSPEDDLSIPARIMWESDCGSVPVVDSESRIIGMITDRDICMAAYTQGRRLEDIQVRAVMSKSVHSCTSSEDVRRATALMRAKQIRRVPVLDANRRPVGMLSLGDLAREAANERSAHDRQMTLEEVAHTYVSVCTRRQDVAEDAQGAVGERALVGAGSS